MENEIIDKQSLFEKIEVPQSNMIPREILKKVKRIEIQTRGLVNDFFGGWVEVKAIKNDPSLILNSLKSGEYYSSQGPKFYDLIISLKKKLKKLL